MLKIPQKIMNKKKNFLILAILLGGAKIIINIKKVIFELSAFIKWLTTFLIYHGT